MEMEWWGTPEGAQPTQTADRTQLSEPESPRQANMHTSKRQHTLGNQAPRRLSFGEDVGKTPAAAAARSNTTKRTRTGIVNTCATQLQAGRKEYETRENIIMDAATALDNCFSAYNRPEKIKIAAEMRQDVIAALLKHALPVPTAPSHAADTNSTNSKSSNTSQPRKTWADIAKTPKNLGDEAYAQPPASSAQKGKASAKTNATTTTKQHEDPRILISVPAESRLTIPSSYAVRKAICEAVNGLKPEDILRATPIKTGWAITPASKKVKAMLMEAPNKDAMIKAIHGNDAALPEKWYSYAIPKVDSAYSSLNGVMVPVTEDIIRQEIKIAAGQQPVSCRPSRFGPNARGTITWIASFLRPVRSFSIFTSDRAQIIKKKLAILRHDPGCQGYCNPARCTREPRCSHCSGRVSEHVGPHGSDCTHPQQCANCYGPYESGHSNCPAKPKRSGGLIVKLTAKELKAVRRIGKRAFDHLQDSLNREREAHQHTRETGAAYNSGDEATVSFSSHGDADIDEATQGSTPTTQHSSTALTTTTQLGVDPTPQRQGTQRQRVEKRKANISTGPENRTASGRPQRLASQRRSLNLLELSLSSITPRGDRTTSSSSEREDMSMSDTPSSCQDN